MRGAGALSLISLLVVLLTLASSQGSWCAAEKTTAAHQHQLHVQEFHGEKNQLEDIQSPGRKLGHRGPQSVAKHEVAVSAVEIKHVRRIAIGHKGGSVGGGSAGAGGGGGTVVRPHKKKNGAAVLPVPVASALALSLVCGLALKLFSF